MILEDIPITCYMRPINEWGLYLYVYADKLEREREGL